MMLAPRGPYSHIRSYSFTNLRTIVLIADEWPVIMFICLPQWSLINSSSLRFASSCRNPWRSRVNIVSPENKKPRRSEVMVEMRRVELLTPCVQSKCSPNWATPPFVLNSVLENIRDVLFLSYQDFFITIYNPEISVCIGVEKPRMELSECLCLAMSYVSVVLRKQL